MSAAVALADLVPPELHVVSSEAGWTCVEPIREPCGHAGAVVNVTRLFATRLAQLSDALAARIAPEVAGDCRF